jgi:tetratricopeptide (TPR) repeat protein
MPRSSPHVNFALCESPMRARCHPPLVIALVVASSWTQARSHVQAQAIASEPVQPAAGTGDAPAASDASAASVDPAPDLQAQYRDVVARAVTEFDAGRWAEARALFQRAHELWPSARTFRTLGMTSFELRNYAQALRELQASLDDARRTLPEDQRAQVAALIEQTRAFVGRYHVQISPAGAELRVDGVPGALDKDGTLVLEVGRHELRARASGYAESMQRLDVQGREDEALALTLQPEPNVPAPVAASQPLPTTSMTDHGGRRLWTWIAGGTAVALAGTSTALWLISDSKFDAQQKKCEAMPGMGCQRGSIDTSTIKATQTAYQVTAVLAGFAAAAAVTLFFVEGSDEEAASVAIAPGAVYARGRF